MLAVFDPLQAMNDVPISAYVADAVVPQEVTPGVTAPPLELDGIIKNPPPFAVASTNISILYVPTGMFVNCKSGSIEGVIVELRLVGLSLIIVATPPTVRPEALQDVVQEMTVMPAGQLDPFGRHTPVAATV